MTVLAASQTDAGLHCQCSNRGAKQPQMARSSVIYLTGGNAGGTHVLQHLIYPV
jgi:hypothetical protein